MPLLRALHDLGRFAPPVGTRKKNIKNECFMDEMINEIREKTKVNKFQNKICSAGNYFDGSGYIDR